MTITEPPYRYRAHAYWRAQVARIAAGLAAAQAVDLNLFTVDSQATAVDALVRGARSAGYEPDVCPAGRYSVFVPGRPALIVSASAGWAALCSVAVDGRLATIDNVAMWEVTP